MLNKKEKNVKNYLLDENIQFSNEDKDIVLNKIKSKINLEVEDKPSFKQKLNLKVVYALVCSLVICVVGFIGIIHLGESRFIDPDYVGKDVESLNLNEGDYCLAYRLDINQTEIEHINIHYKFDIISGKRNNLYLISVNENYKIIIFSNNSHQEYLINLSKTPKEVYELYNETYGTSFNKTNLNDNSSGLLFGIADNGIEFYTRENNKKLSIFVEFA